VAEIEKRTDHQYRGGPKKRTDRSLVEAGEPRRELEREHVLKAADHDHAREIRRAAAFTYVSASLMSLLSIARWIAILRR